MKEKSLKKSLSLNLKENNNTEASVENSPAFVIGDSPGVQTPEKPKRFASETPEGEAKGSTKPAEMEDKQTIFFNESIPSPLQFTPISGKANESGEADDDEVGDEEAEDFNMDEYLKSLQQKAKANN